MNVLVLGSEGQIGAPLCRMLADRGHKVFGIDYLYDEDLDLRFTEWKIDKAFRSADFVFFLAFDVGGSKYLDSEGSKFGFIENNMMIMTNVFRQLEDRNLPFIFASSQMALSTDSPYGTLKKLGEHATSILGGTSVRFWNVYGSEWHLPQEKWHVISDFIYNIIENKEVNMRTSGIEERQFLHVDDCSRALINLMEMRKVLKPQVWDISSFEWTRIANLVVDISYMVHGEDVRIVPGKKVDKVQKIEPTKDILQIWEPKISLEEGIGRLIEEWKTLRSTES